MIQNLAFWNMNTIKYVKSRLIDYFENDFAASLMDNIKQSLDQ